MASNDIETPLARLSFPNLLKPSKNDEGKESYNAVLLFDKSIDISALKKAAGECAVEKWGATATKLFADGLIKSPFLDGDGPQGRSKKTGESHKGYPGTTFVRVTSGLDFRPKGVNSKAFLITDPEEVYAGCYIKALVNPFAWENPKTGKGISFGISCYQVVKDGERLGGGGTDPTKYFSAIPDEGDAPKETKSGKGADAFFA
jgi:hypothetical protein